MKKTISSTFDLRNNSCTGFDYLRIGLSIFIVYWHCIWISTGSVELGKALWSGSFRFIPAAILPMFFALSGFLIAGSLSRTKIHQFVALRIIRIVPALVFDTVFCALLLGPVITNLTLTDYFHSEKLYAYFLNILGIIHYQLPGVFTNNIGSDNVNAQLWTIPFELECYLTIVILKICNIVNSRKNLIITFIIATIYLIYTQLHQAPLDKFTHVPGRMLVLTFLAGILIFQNSDKITLTKLNFFSALLVSILCLQFYQLTYLAAFPIAYITVYIGVQKFRKIPLGDLSYGLFLFHFPIGQTIIHFIPETKSINALFLMTLPASCIIAWISWTFVEKPALSKKKNIIEYMDKTAKNWRSYFKLASK